VAAAGQRNFTIERAGRDAGPVRAVRGAAGLADYIVVGLGVLLVAAWLVRPLNCAAQ
jgi:hypothetical protein